MPSPSDFVLWYKGIRQASANSVNAPHKPLTILFALSKVLRNERYIDYKTERGELQDYIWEFTNRPTPPNCLQPLCRLENDSHELRFWEVVPNGLPKNAAGDIQPGTALMADLKAGFTPSIYDWLRKNPVWVYEFITGIMRDNFPETRWTDVLDGLNINVSRLKITPSQSDWFPITNRDPGFPRMVLAAYDYRCCVCGLKLYLNNKPFPMEAAHIRWKARGGLCQVANGLSLCPTHHYAFDRGLWTLSQKHRVVLSDALKIDSRRDTFFKPYEGYDITECLLEAESAPAEANLHWHRKNVFCSLKA